MVTLDNIDFTKDEKGFLINIINSFGSHQHPIADENTFPFFTVEYVKEILYSPNYRFSEEKKNLSGLGVELLKSIDDKIKILCIEYQK